MSKTKEEILKDCFYKMYPDNGLGEFEDIHHGYCYDAMQEYADQQTEALRKDKEALQSRIGLESDQIGLKP